MRFGKAADVDDAIRDDAHFVHGFFVSHGEISNSPPVSKEIKCIKQVVNGRRQQQAVARKQPLAVDPPEVHLWRVCAGNPGASIQRPRAEGEKKKLKF